jgi:nitrogen fixation protein NifZ
MSDRDRRAGSTVPAAPAGTVETFAPPRFLPGQKVRCIAEVRNDGTVWGRPRGDVLISPGEIGYVSSIGELHQRYYIYAVDFFRRGRIIGMCQHEIEAVES